MKALSYFFCVLGIISLAYWAYNENYATQASLNRVKELQRLIGLQQENLGVLRTEWAYLNRPDRLRELVDLNFASLPLIPLGNSHFGDVDLVSYPTLLADELSRTYDVSSQGDQINDPASDRAVGE